MTLFDKLIMNRYKDLLHVNKGGAGLPSHSGAEILPVVDDGSGGVNEAVSRLAIQHHLNPSPPAASFAETREWSLTGDMTHGELVTDGWAFDTGIAGEVRGGRLVLDYTPDQSLDFIGAYLPVNFTGDFDVITMCHGFGFMEIGALTQEYIAGGIMVARSGTNICHGAVMTWDDDKPRPTWWSSQTYPAASLTVTEEAWDFGVAESVLRICRYSGTIYIVGGTIYSPGSNRTSTALASPDHDRGWNVFDSITDANTIDRLYLGLYFPSNTDEGGRSQFPFLRRFR